jgi:ABC-type bacteriocin/lantibiotic exporter with double-glycine peptidase domain
VAVLRHWDVSASQEALRATLGPPPARGYALRDLRDYAEGQGLDAFLLEGTAGDLREQTAMGRPCLVVVRVSAQRNHSLLVTGMRDGYVGIMDPVQGNSEWRPEASFAASWRDAGSPLLLVARAEAPGLSPETGGL